MREKAPQDVNALAFEPDAAHDPTAKHFIPRAGARKRGLEITFEPSQHKYASSLLLSNRWQVSTAQFTMLNATPCMAAMAHVSLR